MEKKSTNQKNRMDNAKRRMISVGGKKYDANRICRQVRESAGLSRPVYVKTATMDGGLYTFKCGGDIVAVTSGDSIILVGSGKTVTGIIWHENPKGKGTCKCHLQKVGRSSKRRGAAQ